MSATSTTSPGRASDSPFDRQGGGIDRLPGLKAVFDSVAATVGKELSGVFQFKCVASAQDIARSGTIEQAQQNKDCLSAVLRCTKTEARAFMIFDREFVDFLAHRAFGGAEDISPIQSRDLEVFFTSTEKGLVRRLCISASQGLDLALTDIVETEYAVDRIEQITDSQSMGKRDQEIVVADLRFQGVAFSTRCRLGLAQSLVQFGRQKFSEEPKEESSAASDPKWLKDLQAGVSNAPVDLTGILEEVEISLGDLARLRVGNLLELRGGGVGRILLESSGQKLFWCKVGQAEGKYLLEVEEPYQEDDGEVMLNFAR